MARTRRTNAQEPEEVPRKPYVAENAGGAGPFMMSSMHELSPFAQTTLLRDSGSPFSVAEQQRLPRVAGSARTV